MIAPPLRARATRIRDAADLGAFVPAVEARSYGQASALRAGSRLFLAPSLSDGRWRLGIGFVEGVMITGSDDFLPDGLQPGDSVWLVVSLRRGSGLLERDGAPPIAYLTGAYSIVEARLSSVQVSNPDFNFYTSSRRLFTLDASGNIPASFPGLGAIRIREDLSF